MGANRSNLRYASIDEYGGRELAAALKRKVLRKLGLASSEKYDPKTIVETENKKKEVNYFLSIKRSSRPGMIRESNVKPEELVAEKMWTWFNEKGNKIPSGWATHWLQENPLDNFGTTNEQYRRQWLKKTLKNLPAGLSILDAGAGERQYQEYCTHLKYVSQDFAEYDGEGDGSGLQMGSWDNNGLDIVSDITDIPVDDGSFDVIMCTEVFEHIPKPLDAMAEFTRILKPGGTLILTAPFAAMTHFAPYFFHSGYSKYFYETTLKEHGYEILEMDFNGNYFQYIAQEMRRTEDIAQQYKLGSSEESIMQRLARHIVIQRLSQIGTKDKKTRELLCNGIHVRARKLP